MQSRQAQHLPAPFFKRLGSLHVLFAVSQANQVYDHVHSPQIHVRVVSIKSDGEINPTKVDRMG